MLENFSMRERMEEVEGKLREKWKPSDSECQLESESDSMVEFCKQGNKPLAFHKRWKLP
jgi:hypothetical protein